MATFGKQFLQQMANPSFGKGLFNLGQQIGGEPQRQAQVKALQSMGPVEQAQYLKSVARTPQDIMKAQEMEKSAVRESSLRSLQGLEAARQAAKDDVEKLRIERIMSRVAVQAGVDPASISGRTQKESDAQLQREMAQGRLDEQNRQTRERALTNAYYRMEGDDIAAYEKNLIDSGFGYIVNDIKEDKAKDDLFNLQLQNAITESNENAAMKKAALPRTELEKRINDSSIDPELKEQFLSELAEIEEPDFEAGETWNPGQRKLAVEAMRSLNTAVRSEVGREVGRKSALRAQIRDLEQELTKGPTFRAIEAQKAEAKKQLVSGWFSDPTEEEIEERAYDLALLAKRSTIEDLLTQRRLELGEQSVQEPEEDTETEEKETKQIGRFTVQES